jgi:hypothetical protein
MLTPVPALRTPQLSRPPAASATAAALLSPATLRPHAKTASASGTAPATATLSAARDAAAAAPGSRALQSSLACSSLQGRRATGERPTSESCASLRLPPVYPSIHERHDPLPVTVHRLLRRRGGGNLSFFFFFLSFFLSFRRGGGSGRRPRHLANHPQQPQRRRTAGALPARPPARDSFPCTCSVACLLACLTHARVCPYDGRTTARPAGPGQPAGGGAVRGVAACGAAARVLQHRGAEPRARTAGVYATSTCACASACARGPVTDTAFAAHGASAACHRLAA